MNPTILDAFEAAYLPCLFIITFYFDAALSTDFGLWFFLTMPEIITLFVSFLKYFESKLLVTVLFDDCPCENFEFCDRVYHVTHGRLKYKNGK